MKRCLDCKHFIPSKDPAPEARRQWSRCHASIQVLAHADPVDGSDREPVYFYCDVARGKDGKCGPDAKLFEAQS